MVSHSSTLRRQKILVVDDEIDAALPIKLILSSHGYDVEVYTNPKKALASFKTDYYDLILLDVRMPEMNGFELYRELKLLDKKCKICFITAFESYYESLTEFFPKLDVKCFIRKPVSSHVLIDHVLHELRSN
jgi:two-component system, OmpR family, response regulator ChvI